MTPCCRDSLEPFTVVCSQSGDDESRLAETLGSLAERGGWRPSTNVSAPDTQGRGGALQFYKVVIQA